VSIATGAPPVVIPPWRSKAPVVAGGPCTAQGGEIPWGSACGRAWRYPTARYRGPPTTPAMVRSALAVTVATQRARCGGYN